MSKLDELICEFCSNGVETVKIKNAFQRLKGTPITAARMKEINNPEGEIKVFAGGKTVITAKEKDIPNANIIRVPAVLVQSRGVIDVIYYDKPFTFKNEMWAYTTSDSTTVKYLFYVLKNNVQRFRDAASGMGSLPQISLPVTEEFEIPLPPIEVQREIVRILDNFTELTVELAAELTARQKQYEFYRDKLLAFNALREGTIDFYQRTLGELFDFRNGLSKGKEFFGKGTPFIRYTDVYNHRTLRKKDITALVECTEDEKERLKVSRGDVLFTRTSETAEDIGWSSVMLDDMDDCVFNGFTIKATPKTKELLPEYCAYCFSTSDFRQYVTKHCAFTTRASLTGNTIAQYRMTIPPLDIQSRIVNVLDNFEKICSDLNIGLPAEIEARQKQYEYYRDKLLTFAETGNTILSRAEQSRAEQSRAEQSRAEQSRALIKLMQYVFGYVRISLGDIGSICMCKRILKSQTNTVSGVPFYKIGTFGKEADAYISQETFNEYRSKYNFPKKGDVLISAAGTIGRTVVYDGKPAYFQDSNIVWIDNDESIVLNSYLRYCYELKPWKASEGGTIPRLYNDNIAKAVIAVPSIEEQKCVVSILDRFDAICNDLTSGLPAEIEARQKQYEYYRDRLLSFKELN